MVEIIEVEVDRSREERVNMHINLLNYKDERGTRSIWAEMENDHLCIIGQDLYTAKENPFGTDEYEYSYGFNKSNTERLIHLITETGQSTEEALLSKFGGIDCCRNLKDFCEANDIKYTFFSRID